MTEPGVKFKAEKIYTVSMETEQFSGLLEVFLQGSWVEVNDWIFRSWSGPRRIDGRLYDGPVFFLGSGVKSRSKRV